MPDLPSLSILNEEAAAEIAAQERRADALDSKGGVLLGFAGVLVGLSIDKLQGGLGEVATGVAGLTAMVAAAAVVPRSYPALSLRRLREGYLTSEEEFTRLRLLDTRIAICETTQRTLAIKASLVTLAALGLAAAVVLTVVAFIIQTKVEGGDGHEREQRFIAASDHAVPAAVRAGSRVDRPPGRQPLLSAAVPGQGQEDDAGRGLPCLSNGTIRMSEFANQ